MRDPAPLKRILAKVQGSIKSSFRLKAVWSLWDQGFMPVPILALRDPDLKPMHLLLLGLACSYSLSPGGLRLFASQDYLSKLFGVTDRYIRLVLGDLVRLGYLDVDRRAHGRHNEYAVSDRIPETRREALREPAQGLEFHPARPGDRNYSSAQGGLTGTMVPLGTTKEVSRKRDGATLCVKYSPLKKKAEKLVATGMSARSALALALKEWRDGLDTRYTAKAMTRRLCNLGIRRPIARVIAGSAPGSVIVAAAGKLNCETTNLAGAFIWHLNKLLGDGSSP